MIHNCTQCNENFPLGIKKNDYFNCYENCSYYYYFDNENKFHCTANFSCPNEYPLLIKNEMECVKYDIRVIIKNFLNNEIDSTIISNEEEYYDSILKIIENEFTSQNYDISKLDNGENDVINYEKMIITLSRYENQWKNKKNNLTRIDLGECEFLLRKYYKLSLNDSLYIKKIDIIQDGMKTLKVEYDIYAKLYRKNLINLN